MQGGEGGEDSKPTWPVYELEPYYLCRWKHWRQATGISKTVQGQCSFLRGVLIAGLSHSCQSELCSLFVPADQNSRPTWPEDASNLQLDDSPSCLLPRTLLWSRVFLSLTNLAHGKKAFIIDHTNGSGTPFDISLGPPYFFSLVDNKSEWWWSDVCQGCASVWVCICVFIWRGMAMRVDVRIHWRKTRTGIKCCNRT